MNLTSPIVPSRMVMILFGRLWTNPMMTPVKPAVVPSTFTTLPSLRQRRMENSRFKLYPIEPSGIATIMSRKCGNTKKHFSNRAWYRVGRNFVSPEGLWKWTLFSPVTPSLAACGPLSGCWAIWVGPPTKPRRTISGRGVSTSATGNCSRHKLFQPATNRTITECTRFRDVELQRLILWKS
jgi:hypothetical protein